MQNTQPRIIQGLPNALVSSFDKMFNRPGEQTFSELWQDNITEDIDHEVIETKISSNQRNLGN